MLLINKHAHMKGKSIKVNGNRYEIDDDLIADVIPVDAKKLLRGDAWRIAGGRPSNSKKKEVKSEVKPVESMPEPVTEEKEMLVEEVVIQPIEEKSAEDEEKQIEEWPDPTMTMSMTYLRKMADAYDVEVPKKIKKADLIELINSIMYEE
jgi:hypothetical protein